MRQIVINDTTNLELAYYCAMLAFLAVVYGCQVRFYVRRALSRHWPIISATIRKGFIGTVGAFADAGFYEYTFPVKGNRTLGSSSLLIVGNMQKSCRKNSMAYRSPSDTVQPIPISLCWLTYMIPDLTGDPRLKTHTGTYALVKGIQSSH